MQRAPLPPAIAKVIAKTRRQQRRALGLNTGLIAIIGFSVVLVVASGLHGLGLAPMWLGVFELIGIGLVSLIGFYRYGYRQFLKSKDPIKLAAWLDRHSADSNRGASLQSAVELARDRGRYQESKNLAEHSITLVSERATKLETANLVSKENWPRLRKLLFASIFAFICISLIGMIWPKNLKASLKAITALTELQDTLQPQIPSLRLDDFQLTYRPPSYAQRPSIKLRSSSGKIRALPGTEIIISTQARQSLQSATLVITHGSKDNREQSRTAAKVVASSLGGGIKASFIVSRGGSYHFEGLGTDEKIYKDKQEHRIELELDLPPRVRLLVPEEESLEVNAKDIVNVEFSASDDFGLGDVSIAWRILGTAQEGHQLLSAAGNGKTQLREAGVFDLSKLDLQPGDKIAYSVKAQDNDTVNGPKFGASATKELRVYSQRAHHREVLDLQEKALDELIHVLGDNLEKPFGTQLTTSEIEKLLTAANAILKRAQATNTLLVNVVDAIAKDPLGRKEVATAFEKTRRDLERDTRRKSIAVKETQRSFERTKKPNKSNLRLTKSAQDRMIRDLEKNVVYLADLLNDQLMLDAEELTKSLREQQQALRNALEEYKTAPSETKKQALLKAIQDIKKRMSEIIAELSRIRGSIPQDFVNKDALKTEDTMQNLDQIENMIQEGNLDDAMNELEKMLTGTEKMLSEMRDGRQELGDREYSEVTKKAQELYKDLNQIEKEQRELSRKTDEKAAKALERMKKRLGDPEAFIKKQLERIKKIKEKLKKAEPGAHFTEGDAFKQAERRVEDTERALKAKDFGATKDMAEQSLKSLGMLQRETEQRAETMRRFGPFDEKDKKTSQSAKHLKEAQPQMKQILDDINKLMPKSEDLYSKKERQQMDKMSKSQTQLQQRAQKMKQQLSELSQELPMVGEGLPRMLDQAGQAMSQSSQKLGKGDASGSRGQQQKALDALNKFRDALEQMGQQGSGQGGGMPMPFAPPRMNGPGGRGQQGRDPRSNQKVAIPKPEQYKAPAEFREEILDAAKQGTAEQYKEAVRQYYEEIVK